MIDPVIAAKQAAGIRITDEDILLSVLTEQGASLSAELDDHIGQDRKGYSRSDNNYASDLHHPCKRYLTYSRLAWEEKNPIDINGLWRVKAGKEEEWKIRKAFGNIGYELLNTEKRFSSTKHKISGKVDGFVALAPWIREKLPPRYAKLTDIPIEVKSMHPRFFDDHSTIFDLVRSRSWWIAKYPSQLNCYMHLGKRPAGYMVLCTFGRKPKIIPMLKDRELFEYDVRIADEINGYVERKEYPHPIPFDSSVCGMCSFNHICMPLKSTPFTTIADAEIFVLEDYLSLNDKRKEFEKEKARLFGTKDKPGIYFGVDAILENIEVKTKLGSRKYYDIPKAVQQLFFTEEKETKSTNAKWIIKTD